MDRKRTDLTHNGHSGKIVIAQPTTLSKCDLLDKLKWLLAPNPGNNHAVLTDVKELRLLHSGSVHTGSSGDGLEPIHFEPCGGTLSFHRYSERPDFLEWFKSAKSIVTCSNPSCGMKLGSVYHLEEIRRIALSLLLKQMVPDLPVANYLDCSQAKADNLLPEAVAERIRQLGVVSLLGYLFWGIINNGYFNKHTEKYDFGITLEPIPTSLDSLNGLDEWLRFLIMENWQQQKAEIEAIKGILLGPKPNPKS